MVTELILSCVAFTIFVIYNAVAIHFFGIPSSLSNTYYYYNEKKGHPEWKHKYGWIFTVMMFTVALILMPAWLEITQVVSTWSHYFTFVPFFAAAFIAGVGAAPAFRSCKMENTVHLFLAGGAAAFSLFFDIVICWKLMWIVPLSLLIVGGIAHWTKTAKSCKNYWWEMVAFLATFATIITECCLLL